MRLKTFSLITLTSTAIILSSEIANAFNLRLLGVLDNNPGDLNPNLGIIRLAGFQLGDSGIFVSGEAIETPAPEFDGDQPSSNNYTVKVTNAFFNATRNSVITFQLVQANYKLFSPVASSVQLTASLNGRNAGLSSTTGSEFLFANVNATGLPNKLVTVGYAPPANLPLPLTFSDFRQSSGPLSSKMGTLTANVSISLSAGERFALPDSLDICFGENCPSIPEPSSLLGLLTFGTLGLEVVFKRKQK